MRMQPTWAEEPAEQEELFRHRYRVYVEQQGFRPKARDDGASRLRDDWDDLCNSVSISRADNIEISLRISPLERVPHALRREHERWFASRVDPKAISLLSRFTATRSGHRSLEEFFFSCLVREAKEGKRWGLGDCSPHLVPYYVHFGFIPFHLPFEDLDYGLKIPLCLPYWDRLHLEACKSPIGSALARIKP